MIFVRRALLIVLAGLAITVGILQLDTSAWAQRMRSRDQDRQVARLKFMRSHKAPARPSNSPQSRLTQYAKGFVSVVGLEMGLPCAATLGLLAYVRRKRPKAQA